MEDKENSKPVLKRRRSATQAESPPPEKKIKKIKGEELNALGETRTNQQSWSKEGKKKKSVRWAEEAKLNEYFHFELNVTERINVNRVKRFLYHLRNTEPQKYSQVFEEICGLYNDTMKARTPWTPPQSLTLANSLVTSGANSSEKQTQRDREMSVPEEIYLDKNSVPDSPAEPDPEEPYDLVAPRLIPLEDTFMEEEQGTQAEASKLSSTMGNEEEEELTKRPDTEEISLKQIQDQNGSLPDKHYGNAAAATNTSKGGGSSRASGTTCYGGSTYSTPPMSSTASYASNTSTADSYQSIPPLMAQESPYSYSYSDDKKKLLTHGSQVAGQGGTQSQTEYSTAYPSSVTGGQVYNNYGLGNQSSCENPQGSIYQGYRGQDQTSYPGYGNMNYQ